MGRCCSVGCTAVGQKSCTIAEVEPSLHFGLLDMVARHIGQLLSRSNHIITHSSQKICCREGETGVFECVCVCVCVVCVCVGVCVCVRLCVPLTLHESKTGSLNSSWQMGQFPPDWSNK